MLKPAESLCTTMCTFSVLQYTDQVTWECIWMLYLSVMFLAFLTCVFLSSDPGGHRAGARPAAKNWAKSLWAVAPSGRPCWGPESPPVAHHQAVAPLSFLQHGQRTVTLSKTSTFPRLRGALAGCPTDHDPQISLPPQILGAAPLNTKLRQHSTLITAVCYCCNRLQ